jgi:hypothetical protein
MSLAALPQELRDKILEFCLCSERQFEIGNRDKDGVQSVYYSCVPLLQLRTTNKQLWAEASLAWARRHFARLLVSARPSAECTINLAPPSHWEKSTSVCLKDVLDAILAWSLGDMLGLHRFTRVDLRISLSHWMHTKDVLDSLTRSMESYTATDWKLPQVIPLDRWEAKGRVTVCFEQSNDTFSHISGTISVLVPRART